VVISIKSRSDRQNLIGPIAYEVGACALEISMILQELVGFTTFASEGCCCNTWNILFTLSTISLID